MLGETRDSHAEMVCPPAVRLAALTRRVAWTVAPRQAAGRYGCDVPALRAGTGARCGVSLPVAGIHPPEQIAKTPTAAMATLIHPTKVMWVPYPYGT